MVENNFDIHEEKVMEFVNSKEFDNKIRSKWSSNGLKNLNDHEQESNLGNLAPSILKSQSGTSSFIIESQEIKNRKYCQV